MRGAQGFESIGVSRPEPPMRAKMETKGCAGAPGDRARGPCLRAGAFMVSPGIESQLLWRTSAR